MKRRILIPIRLLVFLAVCGLLYYKQRYGQIADLAIAYLVSQSVVECVQYFQGYKLNSIPPKAQKPVKSTVNAPNLPDVLITGDQLLEIQDK